jgi:hypothetical protein
VSGGDILIERFTKNFRGRVYGSGGCFVLEISPFESVDYRRSVAVVFDAGTRREVFEELRSLLSDLESRLLEELRSREIREVVR